MPGFTPAHRGGGGPPLVCLHGFTDTWRTWELVLPTLERHHDVLAPALPGHAGGPALGPRPDGDALLDGLERAMDEAGFETAHVAGNSLGGYLALRLAERGRARSVVAFAPGGGWADGDASWRESLDYFRRMREPLQRAAPRAEAIASTPEGRRRATVDLTTSFEHIPPDLVAHLIRGAAECPATLELIAAAEREGWPLDSEQVTSPVRVVWGTADRLLAWPSAAVRYREWLPQADWVELEGVGHAPQLDVPLEAAQLILGLSAPR